MTTTELVRAWTDEDFRATVAATKRELEHPSGSIDAELDQIFGAFDPGYRQDCPITTFSKNPCCF